METSMHNPLYGGDAGTELSCLLSTDNALLSESQEDLKPTFAAPLGGRGRGLIGETDDVILPIDGGGIRFLLKLLASSATRASGVKLSGGGEDSMTEDVYPHASAPS